MSTTAPVTLTSAHRVILRRLKVTPIMYLNFTDHEWEKVKELAAMKMLCSPGDDIMVRLTAIGDAELAKEATA